MLTTPFQTMKLVIHVAKMQQIMFFVNRLMVNVNCPIGNLYCGYFYFYSSNQAPIIKLNTYMTQFTCSHHGILICEKNTTYLDAKGASKKKCLLYKQLIQSKAPDFTRRRLNERVKTFYI